MTKERTRDEINDDDNEPLTKRDLRMAAARLRGQMSDLQTEMEGIDPRVISVDGRLTGVEEGLRQVKDNMATKHQMASILTVVTSIDNQLKEWGDIPERVAKLEEDVTELMLRR